jgi:hypothetical protein
LFESSVRVETAGEKMVITAMWESRLDGKLVRWKTHTTGCDQPYGNIVVSNDKIVNQYEWSIEGTRIYDGFANSSCLYYLLKLKP